MKILVHHVPAAAAQEELVPVEEINSPNFDFPKHFDQEAICRLGRFLVCYKAKPWMANDLMVIDASENYARSITELDEQSKADLAKIIEEAVSILKKDKSVTKIVVGANINPTVGKEDHESVLRLHVHVGGLNEDEIANMEPLEEDLPILRDEIIGRFKEKAQTEGLETYVYGIKRAFHGNDFGLLVQGISEACNQAEDILSQLQKDFSVVSYSFALEIEEDTYSLSISPKSSDGRGVLEATGIILSRDDKLKADDEFIKQRNGFLSQVQKQLVNNLGAEKGKFKVEAK